MKKHLTGFGITAAGSVLLGPLGLILGVVAWVLIAKN